MADVQVLVVSAICGCVNIVLANIVSVMLGVATMIVVNSVMSGFATEMRTRIRAIDADIVVETGSLDGEPNWRNSIWT